MTDIELQALVEEVSLTFFKKPFLHQAVFNQRLKTTGGRYHLSDHHLDFNPLVFEKYGKTELIAVIKHELCHYHLHLEKKGYRHRDADFKLLLAQTGGSRYVLPLTEAADFRWCYQCTNCQGKIFRKRRINTERYVCGKCRGSLMLVEKVI